MTSIIVPTQTLETSARFGKIHATVKGDKSRKVHGFRASFDVSLGMKLAPHDKPERGPMNLEPNQELILEWDVVISPRSVGWQKVRISGKSNNNPRTVVEGAIFCQNVPKKGSGSVAIIFGENTIDVANTWILRGPMPPSFKRLYENFHFFSPWR